jgi:transcriptional regulator with XRE-family HTH domain
MPKNRQVAQRIGENIVAARLRAGLSQEEAAFRAGIHRTAIGQLERAERSPHAETVIRVAGALGVLPASLLDGIDWTPNVTKEGEFSKPRMTQPDGTDPDA